jgi:phosphodiesterase/alkaline phosphatase D-like protein
VRLVAALVAVTALALVVAASNAATPVFRFGVAAGEITSTSAILWTRAPASGNTRLVVRLGSQVVAARVLQASAASDLTVQSRVTGLRPGRRYTYLFTHGARASETGAFTTAPAPTADRRIRFAISGDADATPGQSGAAVFDRFRIYARMAAERNDFNINLGDTIYSDSGVAGPPARTRAEKWQKYKLGLALPPLRRLRASTGLYSHWDDHEFVNDFSRSEHGGAIYAAGVQAFRDYSPAAYSRESGLYRSVRWGRHLELFFLDERSFRSGKVTTGCGNDLAPTAPQPVRDAFASLAPGLRAPVPPACLTAINDPTRTMLGARQYAAFTNAIKASRATWKVVVNEVPIQQYYALPYDRWEGYAAERERLLRSLQANTKNVVFLTTDAHANLVNEVRFRTLGLDPESSGMWEVVTGPAATNTFAKEIDRFFGMPGSGTAIAALFFKPRPPNGLGMRCAAIDAYSYAQVTVTARTLTVAPLDAAGRPVREATGVACAPLVIAAR